MGLSILSGHQEILRPDQSALGYLQSFAIVEHLGVAIWGLP